MSAETEALTSLRTTSGLTDVQLGRLFGVAPRTLHYWMFSGRMSPPQVARLTEILVFVADAAGTTPAEKRSALLAATTTSASPFDLLRRSAHRGPEINGALPLSGWRGVNRVGN